LNQQCFLFGGAWTKGAAPKLFAQPAETFYIMSNFLFQVEYGWLATLTLSISSKLLSSHRGMQPLSCKQKLYLGIDQ